MNKEYPRLVTALVLAKKRVTEKLFETSWTKRGGEKGAQILILLVSRKSLRKTDS